MSDSWRRCIYGGLGRRCHASGRIFCPCYCSYMENNFRNNQDSVLMYPCQWSLLYFSFVFAGRLAGVREGTVIAALLVGFIARLIGKKLAFLKDMIFMMSEIIQMTAGTTGYTPEFVKKNEEIMTNSLLYDLVNQMYLNTDRMKRRRIKFSSRMPGCTQSCEKRQLRDSRPLCRLRSQKFRKLFESIFFSTSCEQN